LQRVVERELETKLAERIQIQDSWAGTEWKVTVEQLGIVIRQ
jgi:hypothetical protein